MPKFSIILPTHNRKDMLPRAFESTRTQTFTDYELLIVVDGSGREYADFVRSFEGGPVRVLVRSENGGPAAARNTGIAQARGELLAFLDDDDEYEPGFLASALAAIERADARIGMTWCSATTLDYEPGPPAPVGTRRKVLKASYDEHEQLLQEFLAVGIGSGVTIKAQALAKAGLFNTDLAVVDDSEMFLRLLRDGYWPAPAPEPGIRLHNHLQSRMTDITHHETRVRECKWLIESYDELFARYPRILAQFRGHMELLQRELARHRKLDQQR